MEVYLVGGAVRDKILGVEPKDMDYVVLNSSSKELESEGYQKVGINFSVFLHPRSREEYALPRGDTLEEDLYRRDLTINAMALSPEGKLIDPYGGLRDLEQRVLRHVSPYFSEDPLRVFRVLRFKTLHPEFTVAPETLSLIKEIIGSEGFKKISSERVLQELQTVLESHNPATFFEDLKGLGGLSFFFQELKDLEEEAWLKNHDCHSRSSKIN